MDSHEVCSASGVFSWNPKKTDPVFFNGGIGIGHSFGGCKVVQANGSSNPCIQQKQPRSVLVTTLTCATPNCPRTVRVSHTGLTPMAVSGEVKGHRDGDRTTSLSGLF